ncbi:hypothetical protein ASZ90_015533 [hydrocarbon metagenome]|uniref:Uncharacterized protein n=1 Tax=hydrocarbon metagenome TaxID=938273 RepID=A0A0W8F1S4_9ZZZZ
MVWGMACTARMMIVEKPDPGLCRSHEGSEPPRNRGARTIAGSRSLLISWGIPGIIPGVLAGIPGWQYLLAAGVIAVPQRVVIVETPDPGHS